MQPNLLLRCLLDMDRIQEKEIIARVTRGDTQAFSVLVDNYQNLIFHVVKRIVPAQMDGEDICQEVFVKVYRSIGSFKHQSKLSTWIAKIAYLTALNFLKRNKRSLTEDYPEDIVSLKTDQDSPEEQLSKKNISEYLNRLIEQLPEQYRLVLTLYHLEEFSIEEINDITGMPEGTIKSHLYRARKMLKDKIKDHLKDDYEER